MTAVVESALEPVCLNLAELVPADRVLSGEMLGQNARRTLELDFHDAESSEVEIHVPDRVITANSSFLREFIRPSILKLGVDGFRGKYRFTGRDISEDLREEIRRARVELDRLEALQRSA